MSDLIKTIKLPPQGVKYYRYTQTNAGGSFHGPAMYLFVAARTPQMADAIAEEQGVDFDSYCECCGHRWDRSTDSSYNEISKEEFDSEQTAALPPWEVDQCRRFGILYALFVE